MNYTKLGEKNILDDLTAEYPEWEYDEKIDEKIADVYELNQISEYLQDPRVTNVLMRVTMIIAKPNISVKTATRLIAQISALSFEFQLKAKYYMLVGKNEPNASVKKNLYATLSQQCELLAQALKYSTKTY